MKKISAFITTLLVLSLMGFGLTSCSNDDDDSKSESNSASTENTSEATFETIGKTISVTKDTVASTILNLTENATLVVSGGINTVTVKQIGEALKENTSPKISLDFSSTTGMTEIPKSGFEECTGLYSIKLPATLVSVGDYAFKKCTSLVAITIPDSVTTFGGTATFQDCTTLKTAVLGSGIPQVRWYLFSGCSSLESVTFRGSYKCDGISLWDNCTSLKELAVYGDVAENAFKGFSDNPALGIVLEKVTLGGGEKSPDSTYIGIHIGDYAFSGTPIKSLVIREGIESLDTGAFSSSAFTSITFENPDGWYLKKVCSRPYSVENWDIDLSNPTANAENWKNNVWGKGPDYYTNTSFYLCRHDMYD